MVLLQLKEATALLPSLLRILGNKKAPTYRSYTCAHINMTNGQNMSDCLPIGMRKTLLDETSDVSLL